MEKTCNHCHKNRPLSEFHYKINGDPSKWCIICWKRYYCKNNNDPNFCKLCKTIKSDDEFGFRVNGDRYKTCEECRIKVKQKRACIHGCRKYRCKVCGGSEICEHNKRRSECRDCGGGFICEHNKRRSQCRDCGGGSICDHGRRRSECRDCLFESDKLIDFTINNWIRHCRSRDKKQGLFDSEKFIDTDFLRGLIEDYERCYYKDCNIK